MTPVERHRRHLEAKRIAWKILDSHGVTPNRFLINRSRDTIADWIAEGIVAASEEIKE